MSKMHYFSNKFSKIAKRWGLSVLSAPLSFDIGGLSLCDLAKLCFFKLIMAKSDIRKISYDVVSVTSSQLITEKRYKNFPF